MPKYADGITEARVGDVVRCIQEGLHYIKYGSEQSVEVVSENFVRIHGVGSTFGPFYPVGFFELIRRQEETCEHCGTKIYHGPPDCSMCGAPNCCQKCCQETRKETMNGKLTLEEAKSQRRCRVCGDPVGDGRTAWTYNFGKEYAHTACLHPSQVADIHISKEHPMSDPQPEPLVKWPEEDKHLTWTDLAVKEYFVFDIEPRRRQPVCVRTTDGYMPLMSDNGIEHFVEYMDQETVPVRRLKMIRSPQFEVI